MKTSHNIPLILFCHFVRMHGNFILVYSPSVAARCVRYKIQNSVSKIIFRMIFRNGPIFSKSTTLHIHYLHVKCENKAFKNRSLVKYFQFFMTISSSQNRGSRLRRQINNRIVLVFSYVYLQSQCPNPVSFL